MQANVTKITQTTHFNSNNKAEHTFHVQFNVGDHGPFTLPFAKADFTEIHVKEELKKFADNILGIHTPSNP